MVKHSTLLTTALTAMSAASLAVSMPINSARAQDADASSRPAPSAPEDGSSGMDGSALLNMGLDLSALIDGDAASVAQANALASTDPELAAIMANAALNSPFVPKWDETATKDYYNGTIHLAWQHTLGDYIPTPLGSATVLGTNGTQRKYISFDVTGNTFYILNGGGGGKANFDARQGPTAYQPMLIVNGKTKYTATRNIYLSSSTTQSLGGAKLMNDFQSMLFAFDKYVPLPGDSARLLLVSEKQYGTHKLTVYRPLVQPLYPVIDAPIGGSVVADIRASNFKTSPTISVANNIVTGKWGGTSEDALSQVFSIPPGEDYFLTVVIKLGSDWSNQGGKLPGLSNTGLGTNPSGRPLNVDGVVCDDAGWGGRTANGCRWSARTGWAGRSGNEVGLHTYFYAQQPNEGWGYTQNWPTPAPAGQWFAYVERVKLNTVGNNNGRLSYWMCTQSGCNPQFDRSDIRWRSFDLPQSEITEAWSDVFCGGTNCGPRPYPVSTVSLSRMTVTTGLPDLSALGAEVQALNASGF